MVPDWSWNSARRDAGLCFCSSFENVVEGWIGKQGSGVCGGLVCAGLQLAAKALARTFMRKFRVNRVIVGDLTASSVVVIVVHCWRGPDT